MEQQTVVQNNNILVLPFIFFNYWHKKFNVVLGEQTLTQPYNEFLADALLAECNRSACFSIETNDNVSLPDVYTLDVKIIHNKTLSGIQEINNILILPTTFFTYSYFNTNLRVLPTSSDLEIAVSLKKGALTLLEKEYSAHKQFEHGSYGNFIAVNERCIYQMMQCLALATEEIVTDISRDLDSILSTQ
jgi:hypothetical protein